MSEKRTTAQRQATGAGRAPSGDEFERGPGGSRRFPPPARMKGATAFSDASELGSWAWLFETIRSTPMLGEEFLAAMRVGGRRGPKRAPVDWVLLYLDFVCSDSVDVQPWYDDADDAIFTAAGCTSRPCYRTVFNRFIELESRADELERFAARFIQQARRFEPRIGMYLHVDSTEAETHAALVHDCAPNDPDCRVWNDRRERARRRSKRETEWGRLNRGHLGDDDDEDGDDEERDEVEIAHSEKRPPRMATKDVRELRHQATNEPPAETDEDELDEHPQPKDVGVDEALVQGTFKRVKINGCWYRTRDVSAGIRAYTNARGTTRFWHGFYNSKGTDHLMKAPLAVVVACCSEQEYDIYPRLMEHVERNLGVAPRAVVADRGFSVTKVFRWNSEHGIASVIHWRKKHAGEVRTDNERYDRHGVPRCQHCGGPSEFVRFASKPTPRVWFRCVLQPTDECRAEQSISCSTDWRALVPLRRDDPVYLELRRSHRSYEAVHDYWRDRYKVAAADIGQRPKRPGIAWQQLRANGALLTEWLRICYLHGWLGEHGRPCSASTQMQRGLPAAESLRRFRVQIGLESCYGEAAVRATGSRSHRRTPSESWDVHRRWTKRCSARRPKGTRAPTPSA